MKRMDFEELVELGGFEEAMRNLNEEKNDVTSYENLRDFAIEHAQNDNFHLAAHILSALDKAYNYGDSDYFAYDYTAGTCDTPKMLSTIDDIAEHIGFDKE